MTRRGPIDPDRCATSPPMSGSRLQCRKHRPGHLYVPPLTRRRERRDARHRPDRDAKVCAASVAGSPERQRPWRRGGSRPRGWSGLPGGVGECPASVDVRRRNEGTAVAGEQPLAHVADAEEEHVRPWRRPAGLTSGSGLGCAASPSRSARPATGARLLAADRTGPGRRQPGEPADRRRPRVRRPDRRAPASGVSRRPGALPLAAGGRQRWTPT